MFDLFMEHSLPLWLLVSTLFPAVVAAMLIRAAFRIRHLRALLEDATRQAMKESGRRRPEPPWPTSESRDWVAGKG